MTAIVAVVPASGFSADPARTTITAPGVHLEITGDAAVDAVVTTNPAHEYPTLQIAMALIVFALAVLLLAWFLHRAYNRTLEPNPPFPSEASRGGEPGADTL